MKFVVLIHSNPQPWGHPTGDFVAENQALPAEQRQAMNEQFEALLTELSSAGELLGGEALGDPASARLYRWSGGAPASPTDGPYSEAKEHLAGFFLLDVENAARAEEIAAQFAGPGETIELRPGDVVGWRRAVTPHEDVWRRETPHVLGALVRRYGDAAACEDAVQEALLAASQQWPRDGAPDSPRGWLIQVAARRLIDQRRSDNARAARELSDGVARPDDAWLASAADAATPDRDETLALFLLCCHPALRPPVQVALTLRVVGGLTTAQIAAAFLVPEPTMGQRISRAKAVLAAQDTVVPTPSPDDLAGRVDRVLDVLMLVFNEGYATSGGDRLVDLPLTAEAIRLTRQLHEALPAHDEVAGALASMLLTHARTPARTDAAGDLVPLAEQDRARWDAALIAEGIAIVERVLPRGPVGPHQLRAAIAAVHAEAATWAATDWPQIRELYLMLDTVAPGPAVTLNLAVAEAMAVGPDAGLARLAPLREDPAMRRHHRLYAVRAHLLEQAGRLAEADADYATAATLTRSTPEQRYLHRRRAGLGAALWHADAASTQSGR